MIFVIIVGRECAKLKGEHTKSFLIHASNG